MSNTPTWLVPPQNRTYEPARTLPPKPLGIRLQLGGRKPTKEEWQGLLEALKASPERRMSIGTQHPSIANLVFLRYHQRYANGEQWGTKEQLVEARDGRKAAVKRWRQNKARYDEEWKAQRDAKFREMSERQKIRIAASKEAAEEARYGASRRAKAYRKRRAERLAAEKDAKALRAAARREARAKLPKVIP